MQSCPDSSCLYWSQCECKSFKSSGGDLNLENGQPPINLQTKIGQINAHYTKSQVVYHRPAGRINFMPAMSCHSIIVCDAASKDISEGRLHTGAKKFSLDRHCLFHVTSHG